MFFDKPAPAIRSHFVWHDTRGVVVVLKLRRTGRARLLAEVRKRCVKMAQSVYDRGLDGDGAACSTKRTPAASLTRSTGDTNRSGCRFVNIYQLSVRNFSWQQRSECGVISRNIVDKPNGEWFWKTSRAGVPALEMPKLSQWKCPYHTCACASR